MRGIPAPARRLPMKTISSRSQSSEDAAHAVAAAWVARVDAGLTAEARTELARWLAADPQHAVAFEKLTRTWGQLDAPRVRGVAASAEAKLRERARQRTVRRTALSSTVAALALAAIVWWPSPPLATVQPAGTLAAAPAPVVKATPRMQTLEDGTVVALQADAEIAVRFTAATRHVQLVRGEAHFEVVRNRARPFIVDAGGVEVRAVGTAFAVRLDPAEVEVLVTEGRVAVGRPEGAANSADVFSHAGETPVVPAGSRVLVRLNAATAIPEPARVVALTGEELGQRLAWRSVSLDFTGTRLADAVTEVNRYNRDQIVIEDASLADLRVSGIVATDKVDTFVRLVELMEVRAERRPSGEIVLRRAP
ncbi:MAG: hypothetical protein C0518_06610 [Opitutus sp.]|nr:hypothetical protein [Opitutus sp.]